MKDTFTRGAALKALLALPAVAVTAMSLPQAAEAKGGKAQFKYQGSPKNGQACASCRFYLPGKTAKAPGACTLVAGAISPAGWCIAYAKK